MDFSTVNFSSFEQHTHTQSCAYNAELNHYHHSRHVFKWEISTFHTFTNKTNTTTIIHELFFFFFLLCDNGKNSDRFSHSRAYFSILYSMCSPSMYYILVVVYFFSSSLPKSTCAVLYERKSFFRQKETAHVVVRCKEKYTIK